MGTVADPRSPGGATMKGRIKHGISLNPKPIHHCGDELKPQRRSHQVRRRGMQESCSDA